MTRQCAPRCARVAAALALVLCQGAHDWFVVAQEPMPSAAPTPSSPSPTPSDTAWDKDKEEEMNLYDLLALMDMSYIQALVSADPSGDFEALLKNELDSSARAGIGLDPNPPADGNLTVFTFPNDEMSQVVAEVLMAMEDRAHTLSALRMMMRYHIVEGCYNFTHLQQMVGQQLTTLNGTITVVRAKEKFAHGGIALEDAAGRQTIFSSTVDLFASNGVMHVLLDVMRAPELDRMLAAPPPPIITTSSMNTPPLNSAASCTRCISALAVAVAGCATLALVLSS